MEAKHTPGPWMRNTDGDTGMNDSGCILDTVGHVIVTDIYGRTDEEGEANARLIAAAPDLLAVCELVQALLAISPDGSGINWEGPVANQLRAAIARATG